MTQLVNRVATRFLTANVVPFKLKAPSGPTIAIGGRKYVLSDYWPAIGRGDEDEDEAPPFAGGARLIKTPGTPGASKYSFLWLYDTDKRDLEMWRVSDGDSKHSESANGAAGLIAQLDKRNQLNRVTHAERQTIERFMRQQYDDTLKALKKTIAENASEWDKTAKKLAQELFDTRFLPQLKTKMREVEQGVTPLGFKPNDRILDHRSPKAQAKMFVANQILNGYTLEAVDAYIASKGYDPENPPNGDFQATHFARFEVLDEFYDEYFR